MHSRSLLIAALILLPAGSAIAQRGGGGSGTRANKRDPSVMSDDASAKGPMIRGRDLEDVNPIKALIDKRKDLKLSDAQVDGLKKAESTVKDKNQASYKAVDSLAREMKPPLNSTSESEDRIRNARHDLDTVIGGIRSTYDDATKEAMSGFDADQQSKANEILGKFKEDADKRIRDRMKG